jgi:hypothetical protein
VYFHYKDLKLITSEWIKVHAMPKNLVVPTSYLHVVDAYMALILFGLKSDVNNKWFCFLTDACAPIISPAKFRELFFLYKDKTFLKHKPAWWNVDFHKRANLAHLPKEFHLGHDPWFILTRDHAIKCFNFTNTNRSTYKLICRGIIANESIFIIILKLCGELNNVMNETVNITSWEKMSSANTNSPYVFKSGSKEEMDYIFNLRKLNPFTMFVRKVDRSFPDIVLRQFIP